MDAIKGSFTVYDQYDKQTNGQAARRAEFPARVCYNSVGKITVNSAPRFVAEKAKLGHGSVLEHGPVYLELNDQPTVQMDFVRRSRFSVVEENRVYTNLRVIHDESYALFKLIVNDQPIEPLGVSYFVPALNDLHRLVTVDFIVDRGVTHEIVRNRGKWPGNSFSQESTRYCNYSSEKEGTQITVIEPFFYLEPGREAEYAVWQEAIEFAEKAYMKLIQLGSKAQEARTVLPQSTKARIFMTSSLVGWKEFLKLRTPQAAHPQMREVAVPLLQWFQQNIDAEYFTVKI
ncbi:MAG: FAD-dependent thymidylate synthase [Candidatus Nomurabacteria bacterium]|nr:FAD-dependent thymidylate synthase [Candidatus Nomurabacteria bacterium]